MSATEAVLAPGALPPPPEKKAGLATADADTSGGTAPGSAAAVSTDATDSMGKTGKGSSTKEEHGVSKGKGKGKAAAAAESGESTSSAALKAKGKTKTMAKAADGSADADVGGSGAARYDWMPSLKGSSPSRECIRRVRNDIRSLMRDPVPGLFVYPDEDLVTVVHALVTGPFDTPYEGGFFYFVMHCPDDYPHNPPRVRLMTTGGGSVRFNPNLYPNGKVCLSILGTWSGPRWTPVQSVSSVLLSIQSLMSERPYHNEPGFEEASNPRDVRDYSDCITHETLRVAVCSMVGDSSICQSMPECFRKLTRDLFLSFLPRYDLVCEQNMHRDGDSLVDPFGHNKGVFQYAAIRGYIHRTAEKLQQESKQHNRDKESEHNEDEIQRASQPAAAAGDAAAQESASPSSVAAAAVPAGGGENGSAVSLGLNAAETSLGSCQGSGGGSVADR